MDTRVGVLVIVWTLWMGQVFEHNTLDSSDCGLERHRETIYSAVVWGGSIIDGAGSQRARAIEHRIARAPTDSFNNCTRECAAQ